MEALLIRGIAIEWDRVAADSYLRGIEALRGLDRLEFERNVTFLAGENGTGKSTLLEALAVACGFNPEGGTIHYRFATRETHSELCDALRIIRGVRRPSFGYFLRSESFYNVATKEEDYADPDHPSERYHERSHGESFLHLAQNSLRPDGLYLFDEPEAALSPQRQLTLLTEIYECAGRGAQFVIATHSPILLALPGAEILSFDGGSIHRCAYEGTGSYQITELFINRREQMLRALLNGD